MNLFTILNANNYLTINREIARKIGLNAAMLLSEIIDKFCYFECLGQLNDDWFYLTIESVEERTTLGRDAQDGAIKILKELGFIQTKQMCMPAKRHFKVFKEKITEWCNSSNKIAESRKQVCDNSSNMVDVIPQPAPIYKEPKEEPYKKTIPSPPSELLMYFGSSVKMKEEQYKELCEANTKELIDVVIEEINDYIASKGLKSYKDYPATIRNWLRRRKNAPATQTSNPNKEANLEAFRKVGAALVNLGRKSPITLRGNYIYHATGDSIDIALEPSTFVEILCKWCNLKRAE